MSDQVRLAKAADYTGPVATHPSVNIIDAKEDGEQRVFATPFPNFQISGQVRQELVVHLVDESVVRCRIPWHQRAVDDRTAL